MASSVIASGKNHICARFDAGDGAFDRLVDAFDGERIGARHDHETGIGARVDRRFDPVHHFLLRDDFFAGTVAATLGLNLIFDMQPGGAEFDERLHGAGNIESAAPAGIGVHQQGQRTRVGDPPYVDEHIVHGADAQVRDAERIGGDAAARQIERLETARGGHAGGVGIDGPDDLQRSLARQGGAKLCSGRSAGGFRHTRPTTGINAPVTARASSDTRNATTSAASGGVTQRVKSARGISRRFLGVSSVLGNIALTVMP